MDIHSHNSLFHVGQLVSGDKVLGDGLKNLVFSLPLLPHTHTHTSVGSLISCKVLRVGELIGSCLKRTDKELHLTWLIFICHT